MKKDKQKTRRWRTTLRLAIFGGFLGLHRFYVGKTVSAFVYLYTLGGLGFAWLYDLFKILANKFCDSQGRPITKAASAYLDILYDDVTRKVRIIHKLLGASLIVLGGLMALALIVPIIAIFEEQYRYRIKPAGFFIALAIGLLGVGIVKIGEMFIQECFEQHAYNDLQAKKMRETGHLLKRIQTNENERKFFFAVADYTIERYVVSPNDLQTKFKIEQQQARTLINDLMLVGIIERREWHKSYRTIITHEHWQQKKLQLMGEHCVENSVHEIDNMDGHEFEYFCASLLRKNGFTDVKVTRGSGDQGVDVLAKKDGINYAIQCKNYSSPLGNTPVQEVNAGKTFYGCQIGAVMTNTTFTAGAKALAHTTGTLLWDRETIQEMMKK